MRRRGSPVVGPGTIWAPQNLVALGKGAVRAARRRNAGVGPVAPIAPAVEVHAVYGQGNDPNGTALPRAMDAHHGLSLSGTQGGHSLRYGMPGIGNAGTRFYGDLGPLQYFDPVAVGAAGRGVRSGMASARALPQTNGPTVSQGAVQAMLGPGPL